MQGYIKIHLTKTTVICMEDILSTYTTIATCGCMQDKTILWSLGEVTLVPTLCLILSDDGVTGRWNNVSWEVNPESCDETLCKRIVPMGNCYQEKTRQKSCQKLRLKRKIKIKRIFL